MSISQEHVLQLRPVESLIHRAVARGSLQQPYDQHNAVRLVREGHPVGMFARGVCVLWVDAANFQAVESVQRIKGERRAGQPLTTALPVETLVDLMNPREIPDSLKYILMNPWELEMRLGTLCLLRFPVRWEAAAHLPPSLVSQTDNGLWLQSWIPGGDSAPNRFVNELWEQCVRYPGVTSMNTSGAPEIVDQSEAEAFCAAHGIPMFLNDPAARQKVSGSFPILQVDRNGIHLVREGHISGALFETLLNGSAIDRARAHPAKFPLARTEALASITSPYELHDQLVQLLDQPRQLLFLPPNRTFG